MRAALFAACRPAASRATLAVRVSGVSLLVLAVLVVLAGCARESTEARELSGRAEATASIDRPHAAFGDDLTLTIEVKADPALEVELPHAAELPGFRIIDSGTTRADEVGVRVERRWVRLRAERVGDQLVPSFTVRYRRVVAASPAAASPPGGISVPDAGGWSTVTTAPVTVEVRSLLPAVAEDQPPDIRDIKPLQPIERARPWVWITAAVLGVLALAAAAAYWWRGRPGRAEAAPAVPPVPAHEVALAALERLAESEPVSDAEVRSFYFALSEIVRAYVEGRFGLNATDLTTEEILPRLHLLPVSQAAALGLRAFLRDSDRVKFSSHRPPRDEIVVALEWARRFVEETRPVDTAEGPAEASARAAA